MKNVLAIIPARSGSKSVKHKNIRLMNNKPLLAYSIEHALKSERINRVIVSTDSKEYAQIAAEYGAEVPFIRPSELSGDYSLDIEVFQHALDFLKKENYIPDIIVHLRPTFPIRNVQDIDKMVDMMLQDETIDSIRCVVPAKEIPHKMWYLEGDGELKPLLNDISEGYNLPRQKLPKTFYQNACIDVINPRAILQYSSMSGKNIKGFLMKQNFDIDTEEEFIQAENYLKVTEGKNRYVIDIDGVIAIFRSDLAYNEAEPNFEIINIINHLYDSGNFIVLFTARGYVTKKDWRVLTEKQLNLWGLKYHELHFGKPNADYYIDDKMLDLSLFSKYFTIQEDLK